MKPLALSTMYAQQERFSDGAAFARFAAESGYDAIEISHSTPLLKLEQIVASGILPISSVHAPAPYVKRTNGRGNGSANLAAIDEEARKEAMEYTRTSIEWAVRCAAPRLVVHLGQVSDVYEQFDEELEMRQMFDSGRASDSRFAELRQTVVERREREGGPYLEAAKRSLAELVGFTAPLGITIGLENRYHYHEIPAPEEYEFLLDGFALEEVGYWHDVGHAEVLDRLGFIDKTAWLDRLAGRCVGAHLHDVEGIGDHRAPGDGDVDWDYIVTGTGHLARYTLEINQHQPDANVRNAPEFLAGIGLR